MNFKVKVKLSRSVKVKVTFQGQMANKWWKYLTELCQMTSLTSTSDDLGWPWTVDSDLEGHFKVKCSEWLSSCLWLVFMYWWAFLTKWPWTIFKVKCSKCLQNCSQVLWTTLIHINPMTFSPWRSFQGQMPAMSCSYRQCSANHANCCSFLNFTDAADINTL